MLVFEPNTTAIMTASLERCKQLKIDMPFARKFVAGKLKESARRGRTSLIAMTEAGKDAVAELNRGSEASSWRALFRWAV